MSDRVSRPVLASSGIASLPLKHNTTVSVHTHSKRRRRSVGVVVRPSGRAALAARRGHTHRQRTLYFEYSIDTHRFTTRLFFEIYENEMPVRSVNKT